MTRAFLGILSVVFLAGLTSCKEKEEVSQDRGGGVTHYEPINWLPQDGRRVALVIGNKNYQHERPLKTPLNDVEVIGTELRNCGFEVTLGKDLSLAEMEALVRDFSKVSAGASTCLFYYAGHGIMNKNLNYLQPVDSILETEGDIRPYTVSVDWVVGKLHNACPGLKMVLLDCCRTNPVLKKIPSEDRSSVAEGMAEPTEVPEGTVMFFAAAARTPAKDGEGWHSPFAEALIMELKNEASQNYSDLFDHVGLRVAQTTQGVQRPWVHKNFYGRFAFRGSEGEQDDDEDEVIPIPPIIGTDLQKRVQWQELMVGMKADYEAAETLGSVSGWQEFMKGYGEVANPYSEADEAMLVVARGLSVKPAIEGRKAGEEREFEIAPGVKMTMCWCPAGSFRMGSEDGSSDEKPVREVTLSKGYWLGKYEVTQGQWEAVMETNVRAQRNQADPDWPVKGEGEDYPMYYVNWQESVEFAKKLKRVEESGWRWRLPSEAEWEYACRAGSASKWSFGDEESELGDYAWYGENSESSAHAVGEKRGNMWGLCDMHGNVWEWCWDKYGASYAGLGTLDPGGPSAGSGRVLRGGGWSNAAALCRSANRNWFTPTFRNSLLGFRVVLQSQEPVTE